MTEAERLYVETLEVAMEEQKLHLSRVCDEIIHYKDVLKHNESMLEYAVKQKEVVEERIKKDEEFNAKYTESLWE